MVRKGYTNFFLISCCVLCSQMSDFDGPSMRVKLELLAASPVILLPLSSRSSEVLIADLGRLCVNNRFLMSGSEGTISFVQDSSKGIYLFGPSVESDLIISDSLGNVITFLCF